MQIDRNALYAGLLAVMLGTMASAQPGGGTSGSQDTSPGVAPDSQGTSPSSPGVYDHREDDATRDGPADIDRADDMRDGPAQPRTNERVDAQGEGEIPRRRWWKFWQRDREVRPLEMERDDMGEPASSPEARP